MVGYLSRDGRKRRRQVRFYLMSLLLVLSDEPRWMASRRAGLQGEETKGEGEEEEEGEEGGWDSNYK